MVRCKACRDWQTPVRAAWHYSFPIDAIITRLKYRGDLALVRALGALVANCSDLAAAECVIPVPLHRARLAERGYNQAHLIAAALTRRAGIAPPVDALRRHRNTVTQATLLGAARQRNVAGAFSVQQEVQGLSCVLVDDVVTTGSTLQAAAAALRAAGARQVLGIALARAGHAAGAR
ncbi:MAG: phosphoribosyltransferase family protein [Pseudomonadota bacterium]